MHLTRGCIAHEETFAYVRYLLCFQFLLHKSQLLISKTRVIILTEAYASVLINTSYHLK